VKTHAVLSALGHDRVGVADDVTGALDQRKIEIEDSRMTALGGQFAFIVHVSGEAAAVAVLSRDLGKLGESLGFHLQLEWFDPERTSEHVPQLMIESYSSGAPGIGAVTAVLKKHEVNIEDLETEASHAPWTSGLTFHMKARISVSKSCSAAKLRAELRELERTRDLDIVIKPIPHVVAES